MKYLNKTLTIDPGFNTGWAYWQNSLYPITGMFSLKRAKKVKLLEDQLSEMWEQFEALLKVYRPELCYIESVETWRGNLRSSVATSSGANYKLAYLVGGYSKLCVQYNCSFRLIPAKIWKGQMKKNTCALRVKRATGLQFGKKDHITDAVGIGLSRMGVL